MTRSRKHHPVELKIAIVRRHLVEKVPISDLCDEFGVQPSQVYRWQQQLFENAAAAFERPGQGKRIDDAKERRIAALEEKIQRKNEVVAELMEEHVQLKKVLGEP